MLQISKGSKYIKKNIGLCGGRYFSMMLNNGLRNRISSIKAGSMMVNKRTVKTPTIDWNPLKSRTTNLRVAEHQSKMPRLRKFVLGLMLAMPVVSFFLGCWQVKRLKWKVNLISKCENGLSQPPIEQLPPNLSPSVIEDFEYRRFKVKGHFDYSQEMFLGPRMKDGILGYLVVVPFIRSNGGGPILVERGWIHKDKVIPETRKNGYLSHLAFPQGEIEIEALFRIMPKKSSLQFDHEEGSRLFHVPDVEAMAKQSGALPIYSQMIHDLKDHAEWRKKEEPDNKSGWNSLFNRKKVDSNIDDVLYLSQHANNDSTLEYQEFEFINEGVPIAPYPKVKLTNNHLQYLITWFGISIASTGLLIYSFWKKRKLSSAEKIIEAKRKDMKRNW